MHHTKTPGNRKSNISHARYSRTAVNKRQNEQHPPKRDISPLLKQDRVRVIKKRQISLLSLIHPRYFLPLASLMETRGSSVIFDSVFSIMHTRDFNKLPRKGGIGNYIAHTVTPGFTSRI